MAAVKSLLMMYAHVTRIGDGSVGLLMDVNRIHVYDRAEAEAQLAMYSALYPDDSAIVETQDELKVLIEEAGHRIKDCAYFVLADVLLKAGAMGEGETLCYQPQQSFN